MNVEIMRAFVELRRAAAGYAALEKRLDELERGLGRPAKIYEYIEQHLSGRAAESPPPQFPITSQVRGELRELRVRFGRTRYRLLYQRSGNLIVLLHAFAKKTDAVPVGEQIVAQRRMADFTHRMDVKPRVPPRAAGRDAQRPNSHHN